MWSHLTGLAIGLQRSVGGYRYIAIVSFTLRPCAFTPWQPHNQRQSSQCAGTQAGHRPCCWCHRSSVPRGSRSLGPFRKTAAAGASLTTTLCQHTQLMKLVWAIQELSIQNLPSWKQAVYGCTLSCTSFTPHLMHCVCVPAGGIEGFRTKARSGLCTKCQQKANYCSQDEFWGIIVAISKALHLG